FRSIEFGGAAHARERNARVRLTGADDEGQAGRLAALGEECLNRVEFIFRLIVKLAGRAVGIDAVHPRRDQTIDLGFETLEIDRVVRIDRQKQGRPVSAYLTMPYAVHARFPSP